MHTRYSMVYTKKFGIIILYHAMEKTEASVRKGWEG